MMRKWRVTGMKRREWRKTVRIRRGLEDEERRVSKNYFKNNNPNNVKDERRRWNISEM
jgi:hypothetical protein